jgi:hypothetical protein
MISKNMEILQPFDDSTYNRWNRFTQKNNENFTGEGIGSYVICQEKVRSEDICCPVSKL